MAPGVEDGGVAVAVALVSGAAPTGARGNCSVVGVVDVDDLEVQRDRRATERPRPAHVDLGVLVGQHQLGATDDDLGVTDAAIVADQAHRLDGAEHVAVPVEGAAAPSTAR